MLKCLKRASGANYMSLLEMVGLLGRAQCYVKNQKHMVTYEVFKIHTKEFYLFQATGLVWPTPRALAGLLLQAFPLLVVATPSVAACDCQLLKPSAFRSPLGFAM